MAPTNGKPGGATPSLSSLQAALRKGPAAKGQPAAAGVAAQGVKRSLSAEDAAGAETPPTKKVIVKSPAGGAPAARPAGASPGSVAKAGGSAPPKSPAVTKSPGSVAKAAGGPTNIAKSAAPGALAKASSAAPAKAPAAGVVAKVPATGAVMKQPAPGTMVKSGNGALAKSAGSQGAPGTMVKAKGPGLAMKSGGAPSAPAGVVSKAPAALAAASVAISKAPDGGLSMASIKDVVGAIDSAQGSAKIRSVVRLADAIGQSLQIEHINHFLRALKKRVVDRAQQDGVQVPPSKTTAPAITKATTGAGAQPPAGAKAATPGGGDAAKAPAAAINGKASAIAKLPPAAGKAAPPAVQKPKPPQPPAQPPAQPPRPAAPPAASPPSSPPPSGDDPIFALIGELSSDPVCTGGALNDARLGDVLKRLWDSARKPKDWIAGWQAMKIPVEKQGEALQKFMNMAFMHPDDADRAPMVTAELVKAHKVKMRSVEEVLVAFGSNLDGILAINENAWHVYSQFLVHVFPKPANSGWGWSRVGWSWQSWWKFTEQCIQTLEATRASDVLCMILRLIQEREGAALAEVAGWSEGDRISRVVSKICELCGVEAAEAAEKLAAQGVTVSV